MEDELKRIATELILLVRECYAKSGSVFVEDVMPALREAQRVQMEADCKAVCIYCAADFPLLNASVHVSDDPCLASAIRTAYERKA